MKIDLNNKLEELYKSSRDEDFVIAVVTQTLTTYYKSRDKTKYEALCLYAEKSRESESLIDFWAPPSPINRYAVWTLSKRVATLRNLIKKDSYYSSYRNDISIITAKVISSLCTPKMFGNCFEKYKSKKRKEKFERYIKKLWNSNIPLIKDLKLSNNLDVLTYRLSILSTTAKMTSSLKTSILKNEILQDSCYYEKVFDAINEWNSQSF